eukprot:2050739-Rhodomonas_salina.1
MSAALFVPHPSRSPKEKGRCGARRFKVCGLRVTEGRWVGRWVCRLRCRVSPPSRPRTCSPSPAAYPWSPPTSEQWASGGMSGSVPESAAASSRSEFSLAGADALAVCCRPLAHSPCLPPYRHIESTLSGDASDAEARPTCRLPLRMSLTAGRGVTGRRRTRLVSLASLQFPSTPPPSPRHALPRLSRRSSLPNLTTTSFVLPTCLPRPLHFPSVLHPLSMAPQAVVWLLSSED